MKDENLIIDSIRKKKYSQDCFVNFKNCDSLIIAMDIALKYGLKKDLPISEELLETMLAENRKIKVKQIAYKYANYKPRTEKQVIQRLKQNEFTDDDIQFALGFLKKFNLINDEKYAVAFLTELLRKKPSGKKVALNELLKKGISSKISKETIDAYFPDEQTSEMALRAAEKKMRMLRHKEPDKQKKSLISSLQKRGFDWLTIRETVSIVLPEDVSNKPDDDSENL